MKKRRRNGFVDSPELLFIVFILNARLGEAGRVEDNDIFLSVFCLFVF